MKNGASLRAGSPRQAREQSLDGQPLNVTKRARHSGQLFAIFAPLWWLPRNHIALEPCHLPLGILRGSRSWSPPPPLPATAAPARWAASGATPSARMIGSSWRGRGSPALRTSSSAPAASIASKRASIPCACAATIGQDQQPHRLLRAQHRCAGLRLPIGQRPACAVQHLERADDALRVGRHQARGHRGVARGQDRRAARARAALPPRHANARARRDRSAAPATALPAAP